MAIILPAFAIGETIDAIKMQAFADAITAKFNALIDETDTKYPSAVDSIPFVVVGALGAATGRCVVAVPSACYATFVSARIGAAGGDTINLDIEWSIDGFATVNNLFAAPGTVLLTGGPTASVYSGAQLANQSIPANAQMRINLVVGGGAPVDLTVLVRTKRYAVQYNSNPA